MLKPKDRQVATRDSIRQLRLYFKSTALFRSRLASPALAWWLPFLPADTGINISMLSGRRFKMKVSCSPLLPSACRLETIGAPDANALASRVVLHEIGLLEHVEEVVLRNDLLRLVEGVSYALEHLPARIDILKLDCEGSEYHLLGDPRFLDHLRPEEIRMEYHRGREPAANYLANAGYSVHQLSGAALVGILTAHRTGRP